VLPTWRGRLMPTPSTMQASVPSSRFERISRPALSCHGSNSAPSFSMHVFRTAGHPLDTIPDGTDRCFACSESRGVELLVLCDVGGISTFLLRAEIDRLDLLRNVLKPPRQRRKITRRTLRVRNRLRHTLTHRHEQRSMIPRRGGLRHRQLPSGGLARLHDPKILSSSHAITSVGVWKIVIDRSA